MDICSHFGKSGLQDDDDLTDIKQAILRGYLDEENNESDGDENSDVDELYDELGADEKMTSRGVPSSEEDGEFEIALQRIFCEETMLKLESAMKGSREKQGVAPKKMTVTWAPDVYDPEPTTELSTIRGTKQQRSRKNIDEKKYNDNKKSAKKGQKGSSSSCGGGSSKDKKQYRRNNRNSNDDFDF